MPYINVTSMYSLNSSGYSANGLPAKTKVYRWKSVGLPTLTYGQESLHVCKTALHRLESTQATSVKHALGIPKRNHSSHILCALNIAKVSDTITRNTLSLWYRIFKKSSCVKYINAYFLARYIISHRVCKDSLLCRIIKGGYSPVRSLLTKHTLSSNGTNPCGIVDTLKCLMMHQNFLKPYSDEHVLSVLLTRAF